ncbi:MAG: tetratricopeptide repeat protein, partial [Chthoniobacterales bacterium]
MRWNDRTRGLVLFALALLIYGFGIGRAFVFDDVVYISDNSLLHRPDAFRAFWFTSEAFNYYPLFWSLLRIQWLLWGNHPLGYHLVNLLVHCTNALLVWRIARLWRLPAAWWVAALFAVHPVNVQTLSWAAEQKNTWSFLFMALALLAFAKHTARRDWRSYAVAFVCFVAALACKTSTVCLPVFLAMRYAFTQRANARAILLKLMPFFAAAFAAGVTTMWFEQNRVGAKSLMSTLSLWQRIEASGAAFWFYLEKALLPVHLTPMYQGWVDSTASSHGLLPGLLLAIALVACALLSRHIGAAVALGFGYYALMLLPLLGIFDTNYFAYSQVADHWQYHALPGVIVAAVAAVHALVQRIPQLTRYSQPAGFVTLAATALLASLHCAHFEDARTLWTYVIKENPQAWIAWYNLGNEDANRGEPETAIAEYRESIRVKPDYYRARFNLANSLAAT